MQGSRLYSGNWNTECATILTAGRFNQPYEKTIQLIINFLIYILVDLKNAIRLYGFYIRYNGFDNLTGFHC